MNSNRTPEKAFAFCAVLAETCNVGKACRAVGMGRSTAYDWRDADPEFAAAWDKAMRRGVSALEDEAHRRAFEGTDKPLTHQGQFTYQWETVYGDDGKPVLDELTGTPRRRPVLDEAGQPVVATVKEYSDTLAIFLLKAHDPEKYRERQAIEHSVNEDTAAILAAARKRTGAGG